MRMDDDGEHGGRGQSLLTLGETLNEPAPPGPSRLAQAIAQVRAEHGIAAPPQASHTVQRAEPPAAATPRISPLLEALAAEPSAQVKAQPLPVIEDWPRERSTGEVPPLLAAASQWPERRTARYSTVSGPEPLPAAEEPDQEPFDETPAASPITAAVAAVKAVHAARDTRAETPADVHPAPSGQTREKLPFPEFKPLPMAQPGDAFWGDAARVLGLDDDPRAGASTPRTGSTPAGQGRADGSPSTTFSAAGVAAGFRRSLGLIMATTMAGTLLGGGVALLTPRTYSSTAELLADGRGMAGDAAAQQPALPDEALRAMIENQLRVLRSQALLAEVTDRLKLADDPEFDGTAEAMSLSALAQIISGAPGNTDPERRKLIAAQTLARSLTIARDGASFVIDITATTRDPDKSALIANTLAETFVATGGQVGAKGAVRVLGEPTSSQTAQEDGPQATRIMSRAMPALMSNPPSRLSIVSKGLVLGLLAGLGLALVQMARRRFAASEPQEEAAPVAMPRHQAASATVPGRWQDAVRPVAPPPRAATASSPSDAGDRTSIPQEPVAHSAPEEDRPMQRARYRQPYESYSDEPQSRQDRHQPSPYRQAPMRPASYAPEPGPSGYAADYADDFRHAGRPAESYWQQHMPAAPRAQNWQQRSHHPGQQHMLHPHQYPMQSQPHAYPPMQPPQPQGYVPVPGYDAYGEPAPVYGQPPSGIGGRAPRHAGSAFSGYGPENMGRGPHDPRYGDNPRAPYGAEPAGARDPQHSDPSGYRAGAMGMDSRDPRYDDHAPHAYADGRSHDAQSWPLPGESGPSSIDEIRATLRECREAIRELGDKRTRRRYF